MPAKKVNNTSDVIWGNKNIESNARLLPPSRGPATSDPEWNELVDTVQDPTLGHGHTGAANDGKRIALTSITPLPADNPHTVTSAEHSDGASGPQFGSVSVSISAGQTLGTANVTFPVPFNFIPQVLVAPNSNPVSPLPVHHIPFLSPDSAAVTWASMPSGTNELLGLTIHRTRANLSVFTSARMIVNCIAAGAAGSKLSVQYSTNSGSTWSQLIGTANGAAIDAVGVNASPFVSIPAASQADVWLRVVGTGGNGTASPQFGSIMVEMRASFIAIGYVVSSIDNTQFSIQVNTGYAVPSATNIFVNWIALP